MAKSILSFPIQEYNKRYRLLKRWPVVGDFPKGFPIAEGKVIPPRTPFKHNGVWTEGKGWWFQVLHCPYCGKQHYHGWPKPGDRPQIGGSGSTRLSHCVGRKIFNKFTGGGGYVLIPIEEVYPK